MSFSFICSAFSCTYLDCINCEDISHSSNQFPFNYLEIYISEHFEVFIYMSYHILVWMNRITRDHRISGIIKWWKALSLIFDLHFRNVRRNQKLSRTIHVSRFSYTNVWGPMFLSISNESWKHDLNHFVWTSAKYFRIRFVWKQNRSWWPQNARWKTWITTKHSCLSWAPRISGGKILWWHLKLHSLNYLQSWNHVWSGFHAFTLHSRYLFFAK